MPTFLESIFHIKTEKSLPSFQSMQEEQGQKHGNPVADGWAGAVMQTRPDTWQPKLRAGGQGPYLRSLDP